MTKRLPSLAGVANLTMPNGWVRATKSRAWPPLSVGEDPVSWSLTRLIPVPQRSWQQLVPLP